MRLISLEGAENGGAIPSSVDMATDLPACRGWPFELPKPSFVKVNFDYDWRVAVRQSFYFILGKWTI